MRKYRITGAWVALLLHNTTPARSNLPMQQAATTTSSPRYLIIPGTKGHTAFDIWDTHTAAVVATYPNIPQANIALAILATTPATADGTNRLSFSRSATLFVLAFFSFQ